MSIILPLCIGLLITLWNKRSGRLFISFLTIFFVYMIITKRNDKLISYVGYTNNILNRISLHNSSKGAKFTKGKKWQLVYSKEYKNKIDAMKNEKKKLKSIAMQKK